MASNSIGKIFKVTSFGESHGKAIGVVIDGCMAGIPIDRHFIQQCLDRRKPGQSALTSPRKEKDQFDIISGVFEGLSTGHPITLIIPNEDAQSADYATLKDVYRPSHADFTYQEKYGIRDFNGGGRASARITAGWVAAGAIAQLMIKELSDLAITAFVSAVHNIAIETPIHELDLSSVESSAVRCPVPAISKQMEDLILQTKEEKDSLGGVITCVVKNCPIGLGEPVFDKLNANLAKAMFSINAVKGFELGGGFDMTTKKGSEVNDAFVYQSKMGTTSNHSGGIQGGISNGEDIYFKVAFKPTATIGKQQATVNNNNENITLKAAGRHDTCVVPRAVPIVEAMTALVLADHLLLNRLSKK